MRPVSPGGGSSRSSLATNLFEASWDTGILCLKGGGVGEGGTAAEMSQQVKILATEPDDSSSISETLMVKGEAIPTSCPLTPTAHCGM